MRLQRKPLLCPSSQPHHLNSPCHPQATQGIAATLDLRRETWVQLKYAQHSQHLVELAQCLVCDLAHALSSRRVCTSQLDGVIAIVPCRFREQLCCERLSIFEAHVLHDVFQDLHDAVHLVEQPA